MPAQLIQFLDTQRHTVISWQSELTCRPALGPTNQGTGEKERADWLHSELLRLGLKVQEIPSPDDRVPGGARPNLAALLPGRTNKNLWIIAHMDVVPAGEASLWRTDPFSLHVEDDYVYGRGVEDNQQAIVSAMLAARALKANCVTADYGLGLLFVADEETGMAHGLPHVLQAAPDLIHAGDLVLVPDMGTADGSMVEIAEKGCLWLRFTVVGKQCHASTPDRGINSLIVSSALVLELERLYRFFPQKDPLFSPSWSTFVPSKKEANVENINTLPGKDVFYLDCRILPDYTLEEVERRCCLIAEDIAKRYGVTVAVERELTAPAAPSTAEDSEVVRRLLRVLKQQRGVEGRLCGAGGQTVAGHLRKMGIPVAVWATLEPNPHVPNERSCIKSTLADAKTIVALLFDE